MTEHFFSLIPFPDSNTPEIRITGKIARVNNLLNVHYSVEGDIRSILFPAVSTRPTRKDELWKATCFEFFLSLPDQPQYWEFNMSPSGDWNIYKMEAYRRVGFQEETQIRQLPFSFGIDAKCVSMKATLDLHPIIQTEDTIQAGITCIVQSQDKHETYWALAHPNPQADFHLRESFILEI